LLILNEAEGRISLFDKLHARVKVLQLNELPVLVGLSSFDVKLFLFVNGVRLVILAVEEAGEAVRVRESLGRGLSCEFHWW
jgi:hypothetical protein